MRFCPELIRGLARAICRLNPPEFFATSFDSRYHSLKSLAGSCVSITLPAYLSPTLLYQLNRYGSDDDDGGSKLDARDASSMTVPRNTRRNNIPFQSQ